ncbi:hypothetical protein ACL9RL_17895 [Plantibacter sp. Mn2098]|uniref:hypothetical protein n=1 Tax=Plantibacter sp. Mn2098 TaxID=3395266 RepID=UPI003BD1FDA9
MPSPHRPTAGRLTALIALPVLLLGLASCSADTDPASEPAPSESAANSFESWQLKFAQCMRDAGIDFKDPDSKGGLSGTTGDSASAAASDACMEKLGPPPAGPGGEESGGGTSFLEAAKCLRDEGFEIDDPKESNQITIPEGVSDPVLEKCGLPPGTSGAAISTAN